MKGFKIVTISSSLATKIGMARTALLAVEKTHPNDRSIKVLHARLTEALDQAKADGLLPEPQYQAMGGGTDKTQPD